MSKDITSIIAGWAYEPNQFSVRIVRGDDGEEKIQLRLDLGLLQMQFHGRPDGQRPHDSESYLDYFKQKQIEHDRDNPDSQPFQLESADCELLLREGVQYYHRYLSFWHLKLYELCARDTNRNLELFAFVREHAKNTNEKMQFDQWRPYVIMIHTKAVATPLVELRQWDAAIQVVESGAKRIEQFLEEYRQQHKAQQCYELQNLVRWRNELVHRRDQKVAPPFSPDAESQESTSEEEIPQRPDSTGTSPGFSSSASSLRPRKQKLTQHDVLDGLREQLRRAVAEERYEEAARLRDQITEAEKEQSG